MNAMMTISLPLTIVLFVSGVSCTETELPSEYKLKYCLPNSGTTIIVARMSYFKLICEGEKLDCKLVQGFMDETKTTTFAGEEIEFFSMEDQELRLKIYPRQNQNLFLKWDITCEFKFLTQARQFYKLITRNRPELGRFLKADWLRESDDAVMAIKPNFYLDSFDSNITMVIKNDKDDAILIIPTDAISEIIPWQSESREMSVYIEINPERGRKLYEFGFATPSQASAMNQLLNKMRNQDIPATSFNIYRRPSRHPLVDAFFTEVERDVPRSLRNID